MANFEVKLMEINEVLDHPDADRLSIVKIEGYNCISAKLEDGSHRYKQGEYVVYIPSQSILPVWLLKRMGFWNEEKQTGTLNGSNGNRIKVIKLRGVVSEGVIYPAYHEGNGVFKVTKDMDNTIICGVDDDLSDELGIVKYEPPIPASMSGDLRGVGELAYSYDIDNFLKYGRKTFDENSIVTVTEKLHGTFACFGFTTTTCEDPESMLPIGELSDGTPVNLFVSSKGFLKKGILLKFSESNKAGNLYVKTAMSMLPQLKESLKVLDENSSNFDFKQVMLFGEIYGAGVQDLGYGQQTPKFRLFDVYGLVTPTKFMNTSMLDWFTGKVGLEAVPMLYKGKFDAKVMNELRGGDTTLGGFNIREGIVIRDAFETFDEYRHANRKQLKYISDAYLLRKGGTEHN